ncbi:MAG: hypothetical protein GXP44_02770 [bacterium]|nr:hypothetical protein [bacterium]
MIVRSYEDARTKGGLIKDFACAIGSESLKSINPGTPNAGYTRDALEIARLCNPYFDATERKRLRRIFQTTNAKQPYENYSFFGNSQRRDLMAFYSPSNSLVAKEYLNPPREYLFSDREFDYDKDMYSGLTSEAVAIILTRAMVGISDENSRLRAVSLFSKLKKTALLFFEKLIK